MECAIGPVRVGMHAPRRGLATDLRALPVALLLAHLVGHAGACSGAGTSGTTVRCTRLGHRRGLAHAMHVATCILHLYNPHTAVCQFQTQGQACAGTSTWTLHKGKRTRASKTTNPHWCLPLQRVRGARIMRQDMRLTFALVMGCPSVTYTPQGISLTAIIAIDPHRT